MQSRLAHFFQDLATNPIHAARFTDPAQREQFIDEADLSAEERTELLAADSDKLHNLMAVQRGADGQNWSNLQTNQNNNTQDVTRFKRRSKTTS